MSLRTPLFALLVAAAPVLAADVASDLTPVVPPNARPVAAAPSTPALTADRTNLHASLDETVPALLAEKHVTSVSIAHIAHGGARRSVPERIRIPAGNDPHTRTGKGRRSARFAIQVAGHCSVDE